MITLSMIFALLAFAIMGLFAYWGYRILKPMNRNYGWVLGLFFGVTGIIVAYIIRSELNYKK